MFFHKKIARSCSYCRRAVKLDEETVLCSRKGIRPVDSKCMGFRYDPCKRVPVKPKALDFSRYSSEDFAL